MSEEFKIKPLLRVLDLIAIAERADYIVLISMGSPFALDVTEARALRDWLNEVLP